ncbi:MAG: hemolysin family protein [Smithellaceae bacterium]|nr:hemolysin family protein [Smithellaceae bacterium]
MEESLNLKIFLIFLLSILSGLFSCSEAALFSLNPLRIHKMEEDKAPFLTFVKRLLARPRRLLITIIVGNEAINISMTVLIASVSITLFAEEGQWLAIAFATPLLLIFNEAIPKTLGVTQPSLYSSYLSPLIWAFCQLLKPVTWLFEKATGFIIALFPQASPERGSSLTEEEFKNLIDLGQKEGALEEVQRDLIHRVFLMNDQPVSEVMIPRVDMFCLPISLGRDGLKREIIRSRHSRVPVYGTDRDDILGILMVRDLLQAGDDPDLSYPERLLKRPYFVPMEMTVGRLLHDFQLRKIQMAIVVDEFGGVSGLATLGDILEGLFSDMYDDHGLRDIMKRQLDERSWLVSGRLPIDELIEITGLEIPADEVETVGGFVFHLFGKLPARGQTINYGPYSFTVEEMKRARIWKVRVVRQEEASDG